MSDEERIGYLPAYFTALLTAASMNRAIFDEVEGWKSCGVLMPPECRVDNPWTLLPAGFIPMLWKIGFGGCKVGVPEARDMKAELILKQRMLAEFTPLADAAKAKGLKGEKRYYYVFFIGTKEDERSHGYAGSLIRRVRFFSRNIWTILQHYSRFDTITLEESLPRSSSSQN
jgi:hypothetical protein